MGTETTLPTGGGGPTNPFVNVKMEIKLDELLDPKVREVLKDTGSAIRVTVSEETVRRLADALSLHYRSNFRTPTPTPKQVTIVLDALGIGVREDEEADESQ